MSWSWRAEPAPRRRLGGQHPPTVEALSQDFATQGEAESWLGEFYPELLSGGVKAVSLYEADRLVYGPMSLEPETPS